MTILGFVTTSFATLSIAGVLSSDGTEIYLCVLYGLLGIACGFLSWWRNAVVLSRVTFLVFAFLDITSAIAAPSVSWSFQDNAAYVNRVAYFMFLEVALLGSVAIFWHYVTGICASQYLEGAGVDAAQESLLHAVWAVIVGFAVAWFIPLKDSYSRDEVFTAAVVDTIGWWFFGGILAGGLAVLVLVKGGSTPVSGLQSKETAGAAYDQVG